MKEELFYGKKMRIISAALAAVLAAASLTGCGTSETVLQQVLIQVK